MYIFRLRVYILRMYYNKCIPADELMNWLLTFRRLHLFIPVAINMSSPDILLVHVKFTKCGEGTLLIDQRAAGGSWFINRIPQSLYKHVKSGSKGGQVSNFFCKL